LAISVAIHHTSPIYGHTLFGGDGIVQSFFVISGFYVTMIYTEKSYQRKFHFYKSRFFRLAPLWYLTLLLSFLLVLPRGGIGGVDVFSSAPLSFKAMSIASQVSMLGQDIYTFFSYDTLRHTFGFAEAINVNRPPGPIGGFWFLQLPQGWSISTEVMFYILAPFLVKRPVKVLTFIILGTVLLRLFIYLKLGWNSDPWTYRFFPIEVGTFLLGSIGYKGYCRFKEWGSSPSIGFTFLGFFLCWALFWPYWNSSADFKQLFLVLFVAISLPFVFIATKSSSWDRWLGSLSYPVYLLHFLVIWGILPIFLHPNVPNQSAIGLLITLGLSAVMVRYVERPVNKWREHFSNSEVD
jgi:peptidoglycan/LPS O-acetylase OafA/YrhL